MVNEDVLWLITARSGSKSIPNKNIKFLGSIPLLAYKIKTALKVSIKENVWLSTDSQEYADIGREYGATIPFLRPDYLSTDQAQSSDVVLHAMEVAEAMGNKKTYIGLLEPTSPFVYPEILEEAIDILAKNKDGDGIVAVRETRPNTIFIQDQQQYLATLAKAIRDIKKQGRQNFNKQVTPSGGFYISRWDAFKKNKTFYSDKTMAHLVPGECEIEIDEPLDWLFAEFLLERKIVDLNRLI